MANTPWYIESCSSTAAIPIIHVTPNTLGIMTISVTVNLKQNRYVTVAFLEIRPPIL